MANRKPVKDSVPEMTTEQAMRAAEAPGIYRPWYLYKAHCRLFELANTDGALDQARAQAARDVIWEAYTAAAPAQPEGHADGQ